MDLLVEFLPGSNPGLLKMGAQLVSQRVDDGSQPDMSVKRVGTQTGQTV